MALFSLWLLNPENHYSAYRLAHVNTDLVEQGQLTSGQHVQPQSRNETQSGTILCGKALFLSETWRSPCHFMCAVQTRVLKYPLFPLTWRSLLAHLLSACIVEVMSVCLLHVWTKLFLTPLGEQNTFSGVFHAIYLPWLHFFFFSRVLLFYFDLCLISKNYISSEVTFYNYLLNVYIYSNCEQAQCLNCIY